MSRLVGRRVVWLLFAMLAGLALPASASAGFIATFSNETPVDISTISPSNGTPYPSQITVSGIVSPVINDVQITLYGVRDEAPEIEALAVGPGGQTVILMDHNCGFLASPAVLTFADSAASGLTSCASGTYKPSDNAASNDNTNFNSPAPQTAPYGSSVMALAGSGVNGTWSLYTRQSGASDFGATIEKGWIIKIDSGVQLAMPKPQPQQCRVTKGKKPHKLKGPLARRKFCIHSYMTPVAAG
jgi:hypothetical protein